MSSFRQDQLESLKERRKNLIDDYKSANKQIDNELDAVKRNRLKRRAEALEQEIKQVDSQIASLQAENDTNLLSTSPPPTTICAPGESQKAITSSLEDESHGQLNADYKYHIFLSYADDRYEAWVVNLFLRDLKLHVEDLWGVDLNIFVAKPLEEDIYPLRYKEALAYSRYLVPIWSPSYFFKFSTRSCYECAVMFDREMQANSKTYRGDYILPVIVSDGQNFPDHAQNIPHKFSCQEFFRPDVEGYQKTLEYSEDFYAGVMKQWVKNTVLNVIDQGPAWRQAWLHEPKLKLPKPPKPKIGFPRLRGE